MTDDRWARIDELVQAALVRPEQEREAFVRDACGADTDVCGEVLSLLAHAVSADQFLEPQPHQPASAAVALAGGTRLGPYEIVSAIGAGGMGEVYRARDTRLARTVAIKVLPSHFRANPQLLARFEREARAIAALNHPHICTLYDVGRHNDIDFLVMEHIEGETLRNRLRRGPLTIEDTVRYAHDVAEALAAAHLVGLVHRDIKPSNIIIASSGRAKVVDFGLARLASLFRSEDATRAEPTEPGILVGTPNYMSPEQARGLPLDPRTDIYSLGVVIFECLTGRLPFDGETRDDYLQQLLSGEMHSLAALRPDVPPALRDLTKRCLERELSRRIDSASWLSAELDRISDGRGASGPVEPRPTPVRRRRWSMWIVAAATLAAAVIAAVWFWPGGPETVVPQLRRFTTSAGEESDSRISPSGQWISFIASEGDARQLFVQQFRGGGGREQVRVPGLPQGYLQSAIWSDTEESHACLVWQDPDWTLYIVPKLWGSDKPTQTFGIPEAGDLSLLRWIDGAIYLQASDAGRTQSLRRFDLASGKTTRIAGPWDTMRARGFDVRPDGEQVVWEVSVVPDQDDLWIGDLKGGPARRLSDVNDRSRKRFPLFRGTGSTVVYQSNQGGQADLWEIDVATRRAVQRTTDTAFEKPESTSRDGSVSFQLRTEETGLWIWGPGQRGGTQISDETLSDFAPTASADGTALAFQRSKPSPVEGSLQMDGELFLARLARPPTRLGARLVATGIAPALSPDGSILAYLQRVAGTTRNRLLIRPVITWKEQEVSATVPALPDMVVFPAAFTNLNFAWSGSRDLYFADQASQPNRHRLTHYQIDGAIEPLPRTETPGSITDIHPYPDGRAIAYLTRTRDPAGTRKSYRVNLLDTATGATTSVKTFAGQEFVQLLGWFESRLVLVRQVSVQNSALTRTTEVVLLGRDGNTRQVGIIDQVVNGTARLIAKQAEVYLTRSVNGIGNLYAYSLTNPGVRTVSENVVLDVTFGGIEPLGADAVVGMRHRKTIDIHLLDARPRPDAKRDAPGR